jgi:hypothetical protein
VNILLDEGVRKIIQQRLSHLSISTLKEMGWRGIENGELLDLMKERFTVLITTDKNIPYQQNLAKRQISAVILPTNDIPIVGTLLPEIEAALTDLNPGDVVRIPAPKF